ncbi:hypothetical protein [Bacteroides mediterraneensis]|uniref:Aspartate kinase n=1 Tax=Bacteroides mediterraneensis TaxID=1841856 RepID=A0ABS2ERA1_9BACE|nr:hypothetical protein [Bacteroides mediterraneensis]MBM6757121.1 hypothetical protein [Bacteroides mediterraneensis]MBM6782318.1 hypothetical protein [Bacteroides mediterraneensis]
MKDYKLKSVGVYNGSVCVASLDGKSGKFVPCEKLESCKELVYMRLRTLEAVASFRFLERAIGVLTQHEMPVFAMASSAGSFSVVTGGGHDSLEKVFKELSSFAEVELEHNVEVICVQEDTDTYGKKAEQNLVSLLKDIPVLMVSSEEGAGRVTLTVRREDREKVIHLFQEVCE